MIAAPEVWIVLPAYNEAAGLPSLLDEVIDLGRRPAWSSALRVVVVDDGSTDDTASVARGFAGRLPLEVVVHPRNQGLAAAVRTGLEHVCRQAPADAVVVTMDADNTHRPEQIPAMVAMIQGRGSAREGPGGGPGEGADIVIASRYVRGARQAGVPARRALLSAAVGWLLRLRFGLPGVRDYSCGYRAYRAGLLQRALAGYGDRLIESQGFVVMTELLVKLAHFQPRIVEIPLDLRYDRKVGESKMPASRTILGYLRLVASRSPRIPRPPCEYTP